MKIGDFAKACGTSISVLRHYDRLGLLSPVYVDRFTEYRYYDISQAAVYKRIKMLKNAGFSLSEIALMLQSESAAEELFVKKKAELAARLHHLESAKQMMIGEIVMQNFKPLYEDVRSLKATRTRFPLRENTCIFSRTASVTGDIPGQRESLSSISERRDIQTTTA